MVVKFPKALGLLVSVPQLFILIVMLYYNEQTYAAGVGENSIDVETESIIAGLFHDGSTKIYLIEDYTLKKIPMDNNRRKLRSEECYIVIHRENERSGGIVWHINYLLGIRTQFATRVETAKTAIILYGKLKDRQRVNIYRSFETFKDKKTVGKVKRFGINFSSKTTQDPCSSCDLYLLSSRLESNITSVAKIDCERKQENKSRKSPFSGFFLWGSARGTKSCSFGRFDKSTIEAGIDEVAHSVPKMADDLRTTVTRNFPRRFGLQEVQQSMNQVFRDIEASCSTAALSLCDRLNNPLNMDFDSATYQKHCLVLRVSEPELKVYHGCGRDASENTKTASKNLVEELSLGITRCQISYTTLKETHRAISNEIGGTVEFQRNLKQNMEIIDRRITHLYKIFKEGEPVQQPPPIRYNQLESYACYLLDTKCGAGVFLWIGKYAVLTTQLRAVQYIEEYFIMDNTHVFAPVTIVQEGQESTDFKVNFY